MNIQSKHNWDVVSRLVCLDSPKKFLKSHSFVSGCQLQQSASYLEHKNEKNSVENKNKRDDNVRMNHMFVNYAKRRICHWYVKFILWK